MRKFIFIFLLIIVLILTGWYFFVKNNSSVFTDNPAFKAVPIHSPLVVEVQSTKELLKAFSEENLIFEELKNSGIIKGLSSDLQFLKDLRSAEPVFNNLAGKPILISVNFEGNNEFEYLYLASLKDKKEKSSIINIISKLENSTVTVSKRNYDDTEIFQVKGQNNDFSFAFPDGIFIASRKAILVEESIRQSNTESLLDGREFAKLNKTANSNALGNVYINHKTFNQLLVKSIHPLLKKKVGNLANFAEWTELDVNIKSNEIYLNGFTFSNDSVANYANLFKKQSPQRSEIAAVLPANTSLFQALNIEDLKDFLTDFEDYARINGAYYARETDLIKIKKETKFDFLKLFLEIAGNEFAIAITSVEQNAIENNHFLVFETKSVSIAKEKMEALLDKYAATKEINPAELKSKYQVDPKRSFVIYKFPYKNISEVIFGKIFAGVEANYFSFFDNYLIFGQSQAELKRMLGDLVRSETLAKDVNYQKFKQNISSKSNFSFYFNFSKGFHLNKKYLREGLSNIWMDNEQLFRKFNALSWQFSTTSEMILNNVYLKFDPVVKEEPQTIWQTKLDSTILIKPQIVKNHNDPVNKEIIIQDKKNQLYLINKEGVVQWKVPVGGPIISEIHQIDIYRNGKLQYLFNTKNKLYLIDRNGQTVRGFPHTFRSPATNGVSVFDYDNNRKYRFFIAGEDKKLYAYDVNCRFVNGWNQFKTDHEVQSPVKHFRLENKDYIVAYDHFKTYILDRRGNIRVNTNANFEHSANELVLDESAKPGILCTDKKGQVYKLFFDGSFSKIELEECSANHYFDAADLNGDGNTDFVFADNDELSAYTHEGKKIFSKKFKKVISEKPNIYSFAANDKKIGIVSREENRIYLINSTGKVYDGFPLHGNSKFSIGILSRGNNYFNLFVGNEDSSFFNYLVE